MVSASVSNGSWERGLTDQNLTTGAKLARLVRAIDSARRSASLYPDNHPRLAGSLGELREVLQTLCGAAPSIKLTIYQEECFLNGESSEEEKLIPVGFSDRFFRLGLASVVFPDNTDTDELLQIPLGILGDFAE